ncbi:MAG: phosphatase PAP2 family protein [Clostridia bacterium]|nr:phosphatase PAP2 family protein [Clostridia bacterium]
MFTLDTRILIRFNRFSRHKFIHYFMSIITHFGDTEVTFIYGFMMLFVGVYFKNPQGFHALKVILMTQIIVQGIKRLIHRIRPYFKIKDLNIENPPTCQYSFPSGHTASAFSIAFGLSNFVPSLQIFFLGTAILVGLSRMILGYHYPTDVLIGFIIPLILQ